MFETSVVCGETGKCHDRFRIQKHTSTRDDGLRSRRLRHVALRALLLTAVVAIVYLLAGGELPDLPRWLEILLRGGSSDGAGGGAWSSGIGRA